MSNIFQVTSADFSQSGLNTLAHYIVLTEFNRGNLVIVADSWSDIMGPEMFYTFAVTNSEPGLDKILQPIIQELEDSPKFITINRVQRTDELEMNYTHLGGMYETNS